jgi:hypothetical protein
VARQAQILDKSADQQAVVRVARVVAHTLGVKETLVAIQAQAVRAVALVARLAQRLLELGLQTQLEQVRL